MNIDTIKALNQFTAKLVKEANEQMAAAQVTGSQCDKVWIVQSTTGLILQSLAMALANLIDDNLSEQINKTQTK